VENLRFPCKIAATDKQFSFSRIRNNEFQLKFCGMYTIVAVGDAEDAMMSNDGMKS
jgi:hypothetical protein